MRDGECSEQPTLAPPIGGNESGFWPTAKSTDADRGGRGDLIQAVRGNQNSHFRLWPTIAASDVKGRSGAGHIERHGPKRLSDVILWPTPTPTVCGNNNRKGASKTSGDGLATVARRSSESARGRLNPEFVEWLMGWPTGSTAFAPLAMARCREWLQQHGGC